MRYPKYPDYRESNVEWLGVVPNHWKAWRLKFSANLINQKVNAEAHELDFIGMEHVESKTGKFITGIKGSDDSDGVASLHAEGDVLFGKLRPYLAKVYLTDKPGLCTTEFLVLRGNEVTPRFLKYYLLSDDFINIVNSST